MEETYQYMSIKKNKFINIQSLDCERIVNLENIAHINFVENDRLYYCMVKITKSLESKCLQLINERSS